jgi:23S rRNA (uridine2552-2'-O)-methyltransferase
MTTDEIRTEPCMVKKHRSNKSWLQEHHADPYVKQARAEGYRSRAAYKLLDIDRRDRLLRPGLVVVDLGAAPGGWSQVAAQRVGGQGRVVALDILAMEPLPGVRFLQRDFHEERSVEELIESLEGRAVDLVISDMAPNISGMEDIDQPRSLYLAELALDFSRKVLRPGGDMLVKVFQGSGTEAFIREMRNQFTKLAVRKPQSSRSRSREIYLLGRGFRGR